jgi:hypothetical protein
VTVDGAQVHALAVERPPDRGCRHDDRRGALHRPLERVGPAQVATHDLGAQLARDRIARVLPQQ